MKGNFPQIAQDLFEDLTWLMWLISSTFSFFHFLFQTKQWQWEQEILSCNKIVSSLSYLRPLHPSWLSLLQPGVYQEYGGKTNIWKSFWNTSPFLIKAVVI